MHVHVHTHLNYRSIRSLTAERVRRLTLKEIKSPCGTSQPISPPRQNAPISTRPCNLLIWVFRALWCGTSSKRKLSDAAVRRRGLPVIIPRQAHPTAVSPRTQITALRSIALFRCHMKRECFHSQPCAPRLSHINSRNIGLAQ